ncbi:hypothetical protein [Agarivorans sp. 1_MG-2023]|uniref:hypothetical protein n=1 Tax=Agarivorans sp. 1_MG-2023 TaxID=3062634 RepID=UPI0026E14D5A|nr:hypothetical protein [Agarivorans sp. 1_MG-2023]MDO6763405.1 hypothetical protein [Agarivorans sp. 1_MG-2023]
MDWLNSLGDALKNRLTTPVIGAFFISWVIMNNGFVLTLLFAPANWKYLEIASRETNWLNSLAWPLLLTLFYVFVIPWIQYGVDRVNSVAMRKRKVLQSADSKAVHEARAEEFKAQAYNDGQYHVRVRDQELAIEKAKFDKQLVGWERERENLQKQNTSLSEQLESANTNYHNAEESITKLDDKLSEQRKIIDSDREAAEIAQKQYNEAANQYQKQIEKEKLISQKANLELEHLKMTSGQLEGELKLELEKTLKLETELNKTARESDKSLQAHRAEVAFLQNEGHEILDLVLERINPKALQGTVTRFYDVLNELKIENKVVFDDVSKLIGELDNSAIEFENIHERLLSSPFVNRKYYEDRMLEPKTYK